MYYKKLTEICLVSIATAFEEQCSEYDVQMTILLYEKKKDCEINKHPVNKIFQITDLPISTAT